MLHRFRFVIVGLVVVLASALRATTAASAAVLGSLRPAGTTCDAVASAINLISVAGGGTFENMPDMSTSITISAGKRGDVMVLFCGTSIVSAAYNELYVRAMMGGAAATPFEGELMMVPLQL